MNATTSKHPFARAGYVAPYTFLRGEVITYQACPGAPVQAGGCCDVCGTGYRYGAVFVDSTGHAFKTGLDCAAKSLHEYDSAQAEEVRAAKREIMKGIRAEQRAEKRAAAKAKRTEQEKLEREEMAERFATCDLTELAVMAHPLDWAAEKGLTWQDAVQWHLDKGNTRKAFELLEEGSAYLAAGDYKPAFTPPTPGPNAAHVGTVKERRVFTGRLAAEIALEDRGYGPSWILKIVTSDGDLLAWKTGSPWSIGERDADGYGVEVKVGDAVRFKGTVKSHDDDRYSNCPVTWVTRCKVEAAA